MPDLDPNCLWHAERIFWKRWSTSELRVRLAPWNRFKPSSKIFLLTVPRRYFFLWFLSFAFVRICLFVPCDHLLGKGWPLGSRLLCLIVSLSLSHWYPGSGVVLDCIDSWSLHPYLLWKKSADDKKHADFPVGKKFNPEFRAPSGARSKECKPRSESDQGLHYLPFTIYLLCLDSIYCSILVVALWVPQNCK